VPAANNPTVTDFLLLNATNEESDGPNFKVPTTFVGAGDLSGISPDWGITSASPLKNAGDPAYAAGNTDISGNSRPSTGPCAIGAYEYKEATGLGEKVQVLNGAGFVIDGGKLIVSDDVQSTVNVFSVTGQQVAVSSQKKGHSISLRKGVYIVSIVNANNRQSVAKIIVR
jgi:hypothetical protein